jgi:beta-glucanase (GH16 family)
MIYLAGAMLAVVSAVLFATPAIAGNSPYSGACLPAPVFAENFSVPDISPRWTTIAHPAIVNGNGELQAYRPDAIATGSAGLRITATRGAGGYASGRIASKATFRYGCFDIVAKMPVGGGLWPALWLRTPYGLPIAGEIDIMEGFGSHPGLFQGTLHHWAAGVHHGFACSRIGDMRSSAFGLASGCAWRPRLWRADFVTTPHHYGLIWAPRAVTWLIDGQPYFTLREEIPDRAMAIQLNLAVGGVFDGDPGPETSFPATMVIGSVTVWALRP